MVFLGLASNQLLVYVLLCCGCHIFSHYLRRPGGGAYRTSLGPFPVIILKFTLAVADFLGGIPNLDQDGRPKFYCSRPVKHRPAPLG